MRCQSAPWRSLRMAKCLLVGVKTAPFGCGRLGGLASDGVNGPRQSLRDIRVMSVPWRSLRIAKRLLVGVKTALLDCGRLSSSGGGLGANGARQPLRGHTDGVLSVAFSPDGNTLASGSWDEHDSVVGG